MKISKTLLAMTVAAGFCTGAANAAETWQAKLYGADGGLPTGWLPPEGLYFVNLNGFAPNDPNNNGSGKGSGVKSNIYLEVPELIYVTPFQILGAKYAVGIAEVLSNVDTRVPTGGLPLALGGTGVFGTVLVPGSLSWSLANNFFLDYRLAVTLPVGSYRNPLTHPGGDLTSVNYFAFDNALSLSWIRDGWNVSGRIYYTANTRDLAIDYKSGDVFGTEETITKKFGKWTFGVNAFTQTQVTNDTGSAVTALYGAGAATSGHRMEAYGAGIVAGYDFGPVITQAWCDHMIRAVNYAGGDLCYLRTIIPLGVEHDAPKAVAAKY